MSSYDWGLGEALCPAAPCSHQVRFLDGTRMRLGELDRGIRRLCVMTPAETFSSENPLLEAQLSVAGECMMMSCFRAYEPVFDARVLHTRGEKWFWWALDVPAVDAVMTYCAIEIKKPRADPWPWTALLQSMNVTLRVDIRRDRHSDFVDGDSDGGEHQDENESGRWPSEEAIARAAAERSFELWEPPRRGDINALCSAPVPPLYNTPMGTDPTALARLSMVVAKKKKPQESKKKKRNEDEDARVIVIKSRDGVRFTVPDAAMQGARRAADSILEMADRQHHFQGVPSVTLAATFRELSLALFIILSDANFPAEHAVLALLLLRPARLLCASGFVRELVEAVVAGPIKWDVWADVTRSSSEVEMHGALLQILSNEWNESVTMAMSAGLPRNSDVKAHAHVQEYIDRVRPQVKDFEDRKAGKRGK